MAYAVVLNGIYNDGAHYRLSKRIIRNWTRHRHLTLFTKLSIRIHIYAHAHTHARARKEQFC